MEKLSSDVLFLLVARDTGNGSNLSKGGDSFFCDNFGGNFMECCSGKEQRDDIEPIFSNLLRYSWDFSEILVELESVRVQLWEKLFLDSRFLAAKLSIFPKITSFSLESTFNRLMPPPPGVCTAP